MKALEPRIRTVEVAEHGAALPHVGPEVHDWPGTTPLPAGDWRTAAKHGLCGLYKYSGAMHLQERLRLWRSGSFAAILLLHRVTDAIPPDGLTVGTDWFRRLCVMLRRSFRVVSLTELFRLLESGQPLPPRTVALTFDDCYHDNLGAARVLAEHGLPACFFVPTRYVGTDHVFEWDRGLPRLANLDWQDVRTMLRLGHEIGSHTATHADLGSVERDEARGELIESRRVLEDHLQGPVRWLAYPYGGRCNFRSEYLPLVYEAGYQACFSGYGGFAYPRHVKQVMPREPVPYFRSLLNLEVHLTGCLDWVYAVKRRVALAR